MSPSTASGYTLKTTPAHFRVSGGPVNFRHAGPRPKALFNRAKADAHLQALGLDPEKTHLRAIRPGYARKLPPKRGRKAEIERFQQQGFNIYLVVNRGGATDSAITRCVALFVEWDDKPKDWQLNAWRELGLPEPTLQIDTGGKSVHTYWALSEAITPERWKPLIKRLIAFCGSDPACCNPSRVMRLAGSSYWSKGTPSTVMGQARSSTRATSATPPSSSRPCCRRCPHQRLQLHQGLDKGHLQQVPTATASAAWMRWWPPWNSSRRVSPVTAPTPPIATPSGD